LRSASSQTEGFVRSILTVMRACLDAALSRRSQRLNVALPAVPAHEPLHRIAPANVALHAAALGVPAVLVTRVGADARGDQARQRLSVWHLAPELVLVDPALT
jgi:sugar/nucleoside kinase (ribokinase family)